ncbi:hypothetical protein V3C33_15285 [Micrococcaceae bacterium Sec5.7]
MIPLLMTVIGLALWLVLRPPRGLAARVRYALGGRSARDEGTTLAARTIRRRSGRIGAFGGAVPAGRFNRGGAHISMTLVVQQLAALLKGGRTPARLWDELWLVYAVAGDPGGRPAGRTEGPRISPGSLSMLAAARAAALRGSPVADAIRSAGAAAFPQSGGREPRIWSELAACFDIAEASGCPLADVLTRFAAQLEVEDDAEAARQTALAGPKATVSLLTWLPLLGLGLGIALGVDPLAILLGTPLGMAALAAGVALTVAGRIWSARLVRSAAGAGSP